MFVVFFFGLRMEMMKFLCCLKLQSRLGSYFHVGSYGDLISIWLHRLLLNCFMVGGGFFLFTFSSFYFLCCKFVIGTNHYYQ